MSDPAADVLRGRSALITGASRGIGRETAVRLADAGVSLVLVARESDDLAALAQQLSRSATAIAADLSQREELDRVARLVEARVGTPDILVNNAGAFALAPIEELTPADFESAVALNMLTPFLFIRAFLPAMRTRGSGHIVNVGSIADRHIFAGNAAYAASKFGLRAMHEVLRAETRGSGVRATLVSPGPVDTRLWDPLDPDNRKDLTPRESMLDPFSVADAIVYVLTRPARVDIEELRLSRT